MQESSLNCVHPWWPIDIIRSKCQKLTVRSVWLVVPGPILLISYPLPAAPPQSQHGPATGNIQILVVTLRTTPAPFLVFN